ncbi:MAG: bifunctional tetrahydrofolate synthase/dihydrofolate synthase [Proteobacteria bacterium]|nr:MAG: bifunctional tetrahydrofolate synthase/dihydrofolate synthase [Pseudomonadota bacterium]
MRKCASLQDWLEWQESLHNTAIDLGLERIRAVAERLGILSFSMPVMTVAGTNGKGSTVTLLSSMLRAANYTVGTYTSPHILRYNERVAVNALPVSDEQLVRAFEAIEAVRGNTSLTYFEFGTLAAMWIFLQAKVDVIVLEVGLGGRLDATNLWDADVAAVSSVDLDHVDWLGNSREQIAYEKASIARAGKVLVSGDPEPPASILTTAQSIGAEVLQYAVDFQASLHGAYFDVQVAASSQAAAKQWQNLPLPTLRGDMQWRNAAVAVVMLHQLQAVLPQVDQQAIAQGLSEAVLPGRLQKVQSRPDVWLDVAHNPQAARILGDWLASNPVQGKTWAIFSILVDKDLLGVVKPLKSQVAGWLIFPLDSPRACPVERVQAVLQAEDCTVDSVHANAVQAWQAVQARLQPDDRVVIFGSFLVVSSLLADFFAIN